MDKYELKVSIDEIDRLIEERRFQEAARVADTIDWTRERNVHLLCRISDLYKINKRYADSRDLLEIAYKKNPANRKIIYSLCELELKLNNYIHALQLYNAFINVAPRDSDRYLLQYKLYKKQDVNVREQIAVLEEFLQRDFRERWAYELAVLYLRAEDKERCISQCDEIVTYFGDGRFVIRALELKKSLTQLTPQQEERLEILRRGGTIAPPAPAPEAEAEETGQDRAAEAGAAAAEADTDAAPARAVINPAEVGATNAERGAAAAEPGTDTASAQAGARSAEADAAAAEPGAPSTDPAKAETDFAGEAGETLRAAAGRGSAAEADAVSGRGSAAEADAVSGDTRPMPALSRTRGDAGADLPADAGRAYETGLEEFEESEESVESEEGEDDGEPAATPEEYTDALLRDVKMQETIARGMREIDAYDSVLTQETSGQFTMVMEEDPPEDTQVEGQLNLEQIMSEWEKIRKESEQQRLAQARRRVLERSEEAKRQLYGEDAVKERAGLAGNMQDDGAADGPGAGSAGSTRSWRREDVERGLRRQRKQGQ